MTKLEELLIKHEGLRLKPYRCPAGRLTVGVGRNLDDIGISKDEIKHIGKSLNDIKLTGITKEDAMYLLKNDINRCINELKDIFGDEFFEYPEEIRFVLIDMIFNLGKPRFKSFKKMIKAVKDKNYKEMIIQMRDSKWCRQVKLRCYGLIRIVKKFILKSVSESVSKKVAKSTDI